MLRISVLGRTTIRFYPLNLLTKQIIMATKRGHVMSDIPKEGFLNKRTQVIISPTESDTETHISCADPQSVKEMRKEVGSMLAASKVRARGQSIQVRTASRSSFETGHSKPLKDMSSVELRQIVSKPSREVFGHYVPPLGVLPHLRHRDPKLLTDHEIESVMAVTMQGGDEDGALQMYDMMQKYEQWLPCTVDVLRDAKVDMNEFAELLQIRVELERATNAVLENAENAERIIEVLRNTLSMSLKPLEILHLFHKYDPNVLVEEDIDFVAELTIEEGNQIGSDELLERLVRYAGWYPCLMLVLKDSSVGLAHLAEDLNHAISEEFLEIRNLHQHAQDDLVARLAVIKEKAGKEAKKKKKKRPKMPLVEVIEVASSVQTDVTSQAPAHILKKSKAWKKMLKTSKAVPKFTGIDWNRGLGLHLLDHLPTEVETADQRAQVIENAKKGNIVQAPGQHERTLDPWSEGEKYADKFALTELFTFMLTKLVLDTPNRPVDYLIDLTREINRLDMARKQVDQLQEGKKKCEMEAAQRKSSLSVTDLEEKTSSGSQHAAAGEAEDAIEKVKSTESSKLTESTLLSETTEGTVFESESSI